MQVQCSEHMPRHATLFDANGEHLTLFDTDSAYPLRAFCYMCNLRIGLASFYSSWALVEEFLVTKWETTPMPTDLYETNRVVIAERCGWPEGAIEDTREIERRFPGAYAYWTNGVNREKFTGYGAGITGNRWPNTPIYGQTVEEVCAQLAKVPVPKY